ncbi:MAG: hypothetical protein WA183_12250 [Chthoniobacterales bacterium]
MSVIRKSDEVGGTSKPSALNNTSEGTPSVPKHYLTKQALAAKLSVSLRTIDNWVAQKKIPRLALSPRMTRFIWPRVEAALARYEVEEVGARR